MIDRLKQDIAARKIQVVTLDLNGNLLDSCHTHLDLREHLGRNFAEVSPIFEGLAGEILNLEPGGRAFHIPMLTFGFAGEEFDLNLEFFRPASDPEVIVWAMSTNEEFNYKLQQMQQERNDSVILLETIRRQQRELKEANDRLEGMNQGLDRFAYIVSHDLKSPLRAIRNLADWIQEALEEGDREEVEANMALLKKRIRRMENLIEGILDYSRAGRQKVEAETVNVRELLQEIAESNHGESALQLHLPETLPVLHTQRTSLYQVFANLLGNAIKYNDKDIPQVHISAEDRGEYWKFSVKDNGPGISSRDHERIFEMFATLQSRDSYESTGIGLTIVQKVVEEAGGTVSVESELGAGATFSFTWPK